MELSSENYKLDVRPCFQSSLFRLLGRNRGVFRSGPAREINR